MPTIFSLLWTLVVSLAASASGQEAADASCVDGSNAGTCAPSSPRGNVLMQKGAMSDRLVAEEQPIEAEEADPSKASAQYVPGEDGTYSQNYQDVWATSLAKHNNWTSGGFFLDLGAYHGIHCSNSALLEKQLGWSGVCVEPFPQGFEERRCPVLSRPLTNVDGNMIEMIGGDQDRHIGLMQQPLQQPLQPLRSITIGSALACVNGTASPTVSCEGVSGHLVVPNFINFASLDVEGSEVLVLQTFPWNNVKVGAWVVENAVDEGKRTLENQAEVRSILADKGYLRAPVEHAGVDEYFVLPEFWNPSLGGKPWRVHPEGSGGC